MSGQIWSVAAEGGYLYNDELSNIMRTKLQPLCKFRQFCEVNTGAEAKGLHRGDKHYWNVYSDVGTQGRELSETDPIPETSFTAAQRSLTITEYGHSVPYTGKLEAMAKHDVVAIIDKALVNDARKCFDNVAYLKFKETLLRAAPSSGTSTTAITLTTAGTTATTNNIELGTGHIKALSDTAKERNIPPYMGDDYFAIARPTTYRTFKNSLETLKQYTDVGLTHIFSGEIGRYENTRFVEQTHVPAGGANDSTTYNVWTGTADAWNNAKSDWMFYFGNDTVVEAPVIPEEVRAKIPGDYGRSKGIAWYALTGFGAAHDVAADTRIIMWDSAA